MQLEQTVKSLLRDVVDFPKPGIVFKDITPLLADPSARRKVVSAIANHFSKERIDVLAAVEARGFIFGMLIAQELNIPFVPIRKSGKLPYKKIHEDYALEYGKASIEMHEDALKPGARVLIHDDLLATAAAGTMIKRLNGEVAGFSFIINLAFLPGEEVLSSRFGTKPHYLISYS